MTKLWDIKLWEQKDTGHSVFCLQGIPYNQHTKMGKMGWEWARGIGTKGVYITHDRGRAHYMASSLNLTIEE